MRLLGCFCVFLSGFYCVPLVFSSVLEENATSEVLQPSQQPGRLFLKLLPQRSQSGLCLNLKLQVSNHLGWRVEVSTEAAGVGPISTSVVEVPSEDKPILVPMETATSKEICPLFYMSIHVPKYIYQLLSQTLVTLHFIPL